MNEETAIILLIASDPELVQKIQAQLQEMSSHGLAVVQVDSPAAGLQHLAQPSAKAIKVILLGNNEAEAVSKIRAATATATLIVLTKDHNIDAALQAGAQDYLRSDEIDEASLSRTLRYGLQLAEAQEAIVNLRDEAENQMRARAIELAHAIEMLREQVRETQAIESEIRRENQELAILNSIPATVSTSLNLSDVLLVLKQKLAEQLGLPGGGIYTYQQLSDEFELAESWGLPEEKVASVNLLPAAIFPDYSIINHRKPLLFANIQGLPQYGQLNLAQERPHWQSCLLVPLLADGATQGVIALFSENSFTEAQLSFFTIFGQQVGVAFHHARLFEQVFTARVRTQVLSQRLVEIQEEERRNIARELHDEIGQILTGLKLMLEMSRRLPPDKSRANIQEAQKLVGELMSKVRQISLDLRPGMLDDLGLLPALLWYLERYTLQSQVQVNFTHKGLDNQRFAAKIETAAYRIVQEALTNVARHAKVDEVNLNIRVDSDIMSVEIEDHGKGFNPQAALEAHNSTGVAGMGERARLLGGGLTIESEIGTGTIITAHLPLWDDLP